MKISINPCRFARFLLLQRTLLAIGITCLLSGCVTTGAVTPTDENVPEVPIAAVEPLIGRAEKIVDGDTFDILVDSELLRVRLAGIDCPERRQAFGNRAKERLSDLVFGKDVTVKWEKKDRDDRVLGKVLLNGSDVNLRLIQDGFAWFFRRYAHELPEQDRKEYDQAEQKARNAKIGLWADKNPTPPWLFRKRKPAK